MFLFVGPTGTGKTEIAKSLAEFLFGSADRLVRLDMSEYQTPEAFDRLLSDTSAESRAPHSSPRSGGPFAVVLLDEFEKAAQPVLDLFLQVFDDGRLTDLQGRVVDFRRSVIVLTSNIGSPIAQGSRSVSTPTGPVPSAGIERAVRSSFRPGHQPARPSRRFSPFERSAMRALLDKSSPTRLQDAAFAGALGGRGGRVRIHVPHRQGLQSRARRPPLKRAVERHLLAPLAAAIVEQSVPDGDQFLFVTAPAGERIEVTFVDPDAETDVEEDDESSALDLPTLARAARGDGASVRAVLVALERVTTAVNAAQTQKGHALSAISEPGFWERDDLFELLEEAEYLDRLQAASRTAERLGGRLQRSVRADGRANAELLRLLAGRLYVLDQALVGLESNAPREVFVHLRSFGSARNEDGDSEEFAAMLEQMFVGWADRCGMHVDRLDADGAHLLAVSGLRMRRDPSQESGVHVLEHVESWTSTAVLSPIVTRCRSWSWRVPLRVARESNAEDRSERFAATLYDDGGTEHRSFVATVPGRLPLVRDGVRGYRTRAARARARRRLRPLLAGADALLVVAGVALSILAARLAGRAVALAALLVRRTAILPLAAKLVDLAALALDPLGPLEEPHDTVAPPGREAGECKVVAREGLGDDTRSRECDHGGAQRPQRGDVLTVLQRAGTPRRSVPTPSTVSVVSVSVVWVVCVSVVVVLEPAAGGSPRAARRRPRSGSSRTESSCDEERSDEERHDPDPRHPARAMDDAVDRHGGHDDRRAASLICLERLAQAGDQLARPWRAGSAVLGEGLPEHVVDERRERRIERDRARHLRVQVRERLRRGGVAGERALRPSGSSNATTPSA